MKIRNFTGALIVIVALAVTACTSTSDGLELKLEGNGKEALVTKRQSPDEGSYLSGQLIQLHVDY